MKTVLVHIEGDPQPGDTIVLSIADPRGGRTDARYDVPQPTDSIEVVNGKKVVKTSEVKLPQIVAALANIAGRWDGFSARQRNDHELVVQCSDPVDKVMFSGTGDGSGDMKFTFETLA